MKYRRFGRTELQMPVLSCGGMRYQHKWQDVAPGDVPSEGQANLEATIQRALELGINHIETARGYGSSEMQLGWVVPQIPRADLIMQTKVGPNPDPQAFRDTFEKSMQYLKLDYVDLLSFHGINNAELLDMTIRKGGCLDVARELQRDGRVRFVGFSTHAPTRDIVAAIETGEFDYVNLHWYFVNDLTWPAILAAEKQDIGVFIISPSDKGGRLYAPSAKLAALCQPLSPMQFNDLYCLARPQVHTLSIGAARPSDFDDHVAALAYCDAIPETIGPIETRIRAEMARCLGDDWLHRWSQNLPDYDAIPGEVNIQEILRLWNYTTSLDMEEWARSRYNLLGNGGHWQPGQNAGNVDEAALAPVLAGNPFANRIPDVLRQAHAALHGEPKKRQSESEG